MGELLLSSDHVVFSLSLGLLFALLLLELAATMIGGSVFGTGHDVSGDVSVGESDFDIGTDEVPDLHTMMSGEAAAEGDLTAPDGFSALIGIGQSPLMIWLAAVLLGFGVAGFAMQAACALVIGHTLPALLALPIAAIAALAFAKRFANGFARMLPKIETTATSHRLLGGLKGVVSQGTSRTGSAAEVRPRDRHGNFHHLRCEPLRAQDIIPEGTEVLTLRQRQPNGTVELRIIPLSQTETAP